MDGFLIAAIILAVITLFSWSLLRFAKDRHRTAEREGWGKDARDSAAFGYGLTRVITLFFLALTVIFVTLSTYVVIPQQHLGQEVSFGRSGSTYSPGPHLKAPWAKVRRYDGTLQNFQYDNGDGDSGAPFTVQLGSGSYATVEVNYAWKLSDNLTPIYKNYPTITTGQLNTKVVYRDVQQALNEQYAQYDPTAALRAQSQALTDQIAGKTATVGASPYNAANTYLTYGNAAKATLITELAPQGITFASMTIGLFTPDDATKALITKYQNALSNTQLSIQAEATALATATANNTITKNPPTLLQLQQTCLDNTNKNPTEYAGIFGWNCFGAGTLPTPTVAAK